MFREIANESIAVNDEKRQYDNVKLPLSLRCSIVHCHRQNQDSLALPHSPCHCLVTD